jgi:hypothetical protein
LKFLKPLLLPITLFSTILFAGHAVALEPNESLVRYGESIAASSQKGAIKVHTVIKTTQSPMLAYRIDFKTNLKSMMARQDADKNKEAYLMNVGKRELWNSKFCTDNLKNIMRKFQIDLVSGMLQNQAGEMQFLATCFKG